MKKVSTYVKTKISVIEIVTIVMFFVFLPWIARVNFMQNDDWNRTTSVIRFMSGDFSLLKVTATTFYVQGLLGTLFSFIFGWKNLPFLTFSISILNFYIFARILKDHFGLNALRSLLISLILLFTPLHVYSSIGFMTENYTLFFMLLSLYFLLEYEKFSEIKDFVLFNLSGILSFFTKQNGIIVSFAYVPYLLFKKRYKEALAQALIVGVLFVYYFKFFPRTEEMHDKGFTIGNFAQFNYVYSLVYGILLVSTSFLFPIVLGFVFGTLVQYRKSILKVMFIILFAGVLYYFLNKLFIPGELAWEEYPYFENTFERTGFFPRSLHGTKYYFKWNYDLYRYWDAGSKILLSLLFSCLVFSWKKIINIYSISIFCYLALMVLTQKFFDRYILLLMPLFILFLISIRPEKQKLGISSFLFQVIFLGFISFLSFQMAADFININSYIWGKSEILARKGVPQQNIMATMAWGRLYGVGTNPEFLFSFDSPQKVPEILNTYELIEEKNTGFKGSIFVDPYVYLYKRVGGSAQ